MVDNYIILKVTINSLALVLMLFNVDFTHLLKAWKSIDNSIVRLSLYNSFRTISDLVACIIGY